MSVVSLSATSPSPASDSVISQVQNLLFMRYSVFPQRSNQLAEAWLQKHPTESWESLKELLLDNQIVVKGQAFVDLRQLSRSELVQLVARLRGEQGLDIRNRQYLLRTYQNCFLGCDLVTWLQKYHGASLVEALRLGQILIDHQLMHHVTDDHSFKNEPLYYRFYVDEAK